MNPAAWPCRFGGKMYFAKAIYQVICGNPHCIPIVHRFCLQAPRFSLSPDSMKSIFTLTVFIASMLMSAVHADEAAKNLAAQIEGEWSACGGTSNGESPPAGYLEKMSFGFKNGLYVFNNSKGIQFTIDDSKSPVWIDIKNSLNQVGIIKLVEGKIHLCTGVDGDRPTSFSTAPGTDQTYLILERKGAKKAPASPAPAEGDFIADIKKHAEICSESQLKSDFTKALPYVPAELLRLMGGKQAFADEFAANIAELKRRKVTINQLEIGTPETPKEFDGVLAGLVPQKLVITTPQGKIVTHSYLIAISENKGKSWVFVDPMVITAEQRSILYPMLEGKLKIPEAQMKLAE
jgi:uncharacterized protein (TIGR03067 family)